ncbi:hypothetical protein FOCC_FOCC004132 [Frankliniella occidentalis]|nr:hypothetical protein FOCC_FOCC004132 [Frankliniella occidentalis]
MFYRFEIAGWTSWDWSRHVHSLGQPDPMVSGIDLSPLAGIRVISTMIIVCLHRGFRTMRVATSNAEYLTSWVRARPMPSPCALKRYQGWFYMSHRQARSHSRFAWVYRGTLCVDTFFLLAGLLLAAVTRADRKSSFPNIMFNRALRLLPVYAIVVLFCCTALPDMGEGPLWVEVAQPVADSCRKWWWSNLLFIQNYVNGGTDEPMVPDAMSDCVISFAVSFWLFVVVEAPIRSVAKKALSRLGDSSKPQSKTALIRKSD